jgi:hypothetical protein
MLGDFGSHGFWCASEEFEPFVRAERVIVAVTPIDMPTNVLHHDVWRAALTNE